MHGYIEKNCYNRPYMVQWRSRCSKCCVNKHYGIITFVYRIEYVESRDLSCEMEFTEQIFLSWSPSSVLEPKLIMQPSWSQEHFASAFFDLRPADAWIPEADFALILDVFRSSFFYNFVCNMFRILRLIYLSWPESSARSTFKPLFHISIKLFSALVMVLFRRRSLLYLQLIFVSPLVPYNTFIHLSLYGPAYNVNSL